MELTIDTSTNMAGAALSDKGRVLADFTWQTDQNHTVELIPRVIYLLQLRRADIHDTTAIIVAKGPGSFNGLRVGLSTAKGLAFALGIPLVTISTLEAIAFSHADAVFPICPMMNAGRSEITAATFETRSGKWERIVPEHITTIEELSAAIRERTLFCGEINPETSARLKKELGDNAVFPERPPALRRISCLCELGWRRIESGDLDDVRTAQPLYLKKPSITIPKKRRHDAMSDMRPGVQ
ncbi:MAG: tRNA (adenosine(37)-N6)-threonylcarbamoyltransferase complex dimerization subunit type 1 TsaB [Dehalococcoidia bacterium]|nr:tRNA (adenosine(37)-N6)-threonylcarbamoyltransferase complex dimerization subunit type 1 TsaB [Dehalococcoidia bacterium]